MPRGSNEQKNDVTLQSRLVSQQGLDVVQNTNVQAEQRDPTAIVQALRQFSAGVGGVMRQRKEKEDRAAFVRGQRDSMTGEGDDELAANSAAYRKGLHGMDGLTEGLRMNREATAELDREMRTNPNFDFDTWKAEKLKSLYDGDDDVDRLEGKHRVAQQFEQSISAQYASRRAALEVKQAETSFGSLVREAALNGAIGKNGLATLYKVGADSGLDDDEMHRIAGHQLADVIASDVDNGGKLYEQAQSAGLLANGDVGDALAKAEEHRKLKAKQAEELRLKKSEEQQFVFMNEAYSRMDRGALTPGWLKEAVGEKYLSGEQAASLLERQRSKLEADAKEAAKAAKEAGEQKLALGELIAGRGQFHQGDTKMNGAIKRTMDTLGDQAMIAATSPDQGMASQGLAALGNVLSLAQRNSMMPAAVKDTFNAFDPGNARAPQLAEVYRQMRGGGQAGYLKAQLSSEAYASLEAYSEAVEAGVDPKAVLEQFNQRKLPEDQVRQRIMVNGKAIDKAISKVSDDAELSGLLAGPFRAAYAAQLRLGYSDDAALDAAVKQVKNQWDFYNGVPMRKGTMSDGLKEALPYYLDFHLGPALRREYGDKFDADDLQLVPAPNRPGTFLLQVRGSATPVTMKNANGKQDIVVINDRDVVENVTRSKAQTAAPPSDWIGDPPIQF